MKMALHKQTSAANDAICRGSGYSECVKTASAGRVAADDDPCVVPVPFDVDLRGIQY